jgi:internalin A
MAKDEAYRLAEHIIEKARRSNATELSLRGAYGNKALKLTEWPKSLSQLTQLRTLDLSFNRLSSLPESLCQLSQLESLNLTENALTSLPQSLDELAQLQFLDARYNGLRSLPERLGRLGKLTYLNISGNKLTFLPRSFSQLRSLKKLVIRETGFDALPPAILELQELIELYAEKNRFSLLPPEIGRLTRLETLVVDHNRLVTLPKEFEKLQALKTLSIVGNQLKTLPTEIQQLRSLQELYLHQNPELGLPEDALGPERFRTAKETPPKSPPEILGYYFSTRGDQGVALREMKLIVVGWGKAGKTTLVKRLAGKAMDRSEPETHGILISPLTLHCLDGDLKARVWDFGGQHVLHAMHEFFLTARSLYLLVIEQRGDRAEADAKYWLQLIRSYAPNAPVVVALNKSRGIERPLDKESLEKLYGPIVAWIPTECSPEADCSGAEASVEKLRTTLTTAAEERTMPEPRKRFPKKWVAIKDWLEGLDKVGTSFLDYETFSRECSHRGEPVPEKQTEVAAFMHDLGVAMNYARDERLRDTTVLRPDWLANGIYAVLRANLFLPGKPLVPDAVLTAKKLGEIYSVAGQKPIEMLNSKDYPPDKWEFLLSLMNLFQLSFPLNEDCSRQLCPTLLPAEPPPDTDEPKDAEIIKLRYEFAVVPAPLLPRFMVRSFSLIDQAKLWQRGAILRYPGARARVWTTAEEKYLFATVAGPEGDRTELLSIIRATLAELFSEYLNLKVTEQRWFDGQWVPRKTLEKFGVLEPEWEEGAEGREETL